MELVLETHATTVDNETGRATGWLPGELSELGKLQAEELGRRRRGDGISTVFCSDLARAAQTAAIAFAGTAIPVLHDWRLRECNYGECNGMPAADLKAGRRDHVNDPYPGGESWRQAVARVGRFLDDLSTYGDGPRALIIGHIAPRWGLEYFLRGVPLEDLAEEDFVWQPGWEYRLGED
jgi:2,3-bisphosphoglycerate-dependent phosphoglycerate mutase